MILLGIETATERLSAALLADGRVYERHTDSRSSHCELLTGFIEELAAEADIAISDIGGIAVSNGPGSFTGLRIGLASAMGLAYGLGIQIAPVGTLTALAWKAAASGALVCSLIDAKRSEAYTAVLRSSHDGIPRIVMEPAAVSINRLAGILRVLHEPVVATGPAAERFRDVLENEVPGIEFVPAEHALPNAVSVARIGEIIFREGNTIDPSTVSPLYLRRSDAEIAMAAKRKSFC